MLHSRPRIPNSVQFGLYVRTTRFVDQPTNEQSKKHRTLSKMRREESDDKDPIIVPGSYWVV